MRKYKKKSNLVNNTGYTPGYSSEDNPINYIPSENITMRNTPYPVYGQPLDQNGNPIASPTYMEPGNDYKFGGASYVAEVPAYKDGGQKSDWISNKIGILMREGRPQKQAIAIAYSMWNQKHEMGGTQLPMMQNGNYYQNNLAGMQTNYTGATPQLPNKPVDLNAPTASDYKMYADNQALGMSNGQVISISPEELKNPTQEANIPDAELKSRMAFNKQVNTAANNYDENGNAVDTSLAAEARKKAETSGSGITQFVNPYGDYSMADKFGFSGEYLQKKGFANKAAGALAGLSGVADAAAAFTGPMAAQKRQNQIMKGYAEDQRSYMTGEGKETAMAYGGYFQEGGEEGLDEEMGYESELINKYPNSTKAKAEIAARNPVFGPKEMPEDYVYPEATTEASKPSASARDTWEQKTGMPWSKAKELGYTSGTANDNIKLLSELNDPRFKKENLRTKPLAAVAPAKTTPRKVVKENPKAAPETTYDQNVYNSIATQGSQYFGSPRWRALLNTAGVTGDRIDLLGNRDKKEFLAAQDVANKINEKGEVERYFSGETSGGRGGLQAIADSYARGALAPKAAQKYEDWLKRADSVNEYNKKVSGFRSNLKKSKPSQVVKKPEQRVNSLSGSMTFGFGNGGFFQEGGMQPGMEEEQMMMEGSQEGQGEVPQQGGGDQMQAIAQEVAGMLQQGADPQQILQQLVQAGIPEDQATQIIQMVMEQMQGGQQEATPQLGQGGQMIKRADGSYSKRGMWDNIRDNKGSGRKPTAEMLEQERKIKANKKELGGYMYADGGINNPGFKSLPKQVQDKIKASMYQEGGEAMDEEMEGEDEGTEGETPNMEQIESQVEQALKQGADPQEVLQQLVEMGMPEEQAVQMIQELLQEMQGGEEEEEGPMMKNGGEYLAALKGRTIKNYTYNKNTGNYDVEFE